MVHDLFCWSSTARGAAANGVIVLVTVGDCNLIADCRDATLDSPGERIETPGNAKLETGAGAIGVNVGDGGSPLLEDDTTGCIVKIGELAEDDPTVCIVITGETEIPSALERPDSGKNVPDVFMVEFGTMNSFTFV